MANKVEAELEEPIEFSNLYRLEFVKDGAEDEVVLFKLNKQYSELPFLNVGGIVMRYIVEEPIKTTEILNFDYTKSTPVALVPIMGCPISAPCNGSDCTEDEKFEVGKYVVGSSPIIPPRHKLKLTISLTMPESDYNRKLGIFQVRVDFLTANGKVTTSSRYPCMLRFKSHLLRYLETFIKSLPLLAGYSSESQILDLEMRGMNEENEPTSCLKVILEQRAEYKPGARIPEIYAASMVLESELPLYKRIVWNWRKTIFVWTSMISFVMELIMILVCCRPIILPRAKPRLFSAGSANKIAAAKNIALIKGS
ncbi:Adipose-regulatory protein [Macleaya cordata]|uniref:Adipose-regulatory protein n=1 Tax=Macleaya cordata TaxID=56857 RepID=A0A200R0B9_MACCD|nr:Adipose-regulatory protein [Macleaya cordata]